MQLFLQHNLLDGIRPLLHAGQFKGNHKRLIPQCKTTCVCERPVLLLKDLKAREGFEKVWNYWCSIGGTLLAERGRRMRRREGERGDVQKGPESKRRNNTLFVSYFFRAFLGKTSIRCPPPPPIAWGKMQI
jgi:hypothetical protein